MTHKRCGCAAQTLDKQALDTCYSDSVIDIVGGGCFAASVFCLISCEQGLAAPKKIEEEICNT